MSAPIVKNRGCSYEAAKVVDKPAAVGGIAVGPVASQEVVDSKAVTVVLDRSATWWRVVVRVKRC